MARIDCTLGEFFQIGREIRIHLTGRVGEVLYIFIDAATRHELGGVDGFHASAPSGIRRCGHVLALCDGDSFSIGPVAIVVEAVQIQIPGARVLREVRLCLDLSLPLAVVRKSWPRPQLSSRRLIASCWS